MAQGGARPRHKQNGPVPLISADWGGSSNFQSESILKTNRFVARQSRKPLDKTSEWNVARCGKSAWSVRRTHPSPRLSKERGHSVYGAALPLLVPRRGVRFPRHHRCPADHLWLKISWPGGVAAPRKMTRSSLAGADGVVVIPQSRTGQRPEKQPGAYGPLKGASVFIDSAFPGREFPGRTPKSPVALH